MLAKLANLTTLRGLTGLSKTLVRPNNICAVRCYSNKLITPTYSKQLNCLPKPITFKNALVPSSQQLTKIVGNNLIQKRSQSTHGDHTNLWKLERVVAALFLPLVPLVPVLDSKVLDTVLAILTVIHAHWGLEALIIDYARPIVVGPVVPKILFVALYLTSAITLAGLLALVYNGPGITKTCKQIWALGKDK